MSLQPEVRGALQRATALFGWASPGLAVAAAACLAWLPISDPDRKDLEDLIVIPALGILSIAFALVAVATGLAALVGNHGRLPRPVAVPWAACGLLLMLGALVVASRA
jgi:hypothetical protein